MCGYLSDISQKLPEGLWNDKGKIDASISPLIPEGKIGDVYTVENSGLIGNNGSIEPGIFVEDGDLFICIKDNGGGVVTGIRDSWNVVLGRRFL